MLAIHFRYLFPTVIAALISLWAPAVLAQYEGWTIPAGAKTEKSPFAGSTADAVRKGKAIFQGKCQRCHGPEGLGNGAEADRRSPPADLTKIKAAENPDGVLFYKIWNGHDPKPKAKGEMPAFKVQLPKEDVWRTVEYIKTLRAK
jgi:mono/diheme cytochrome c family protein